jgi:DNA-binding NarL/FixJ family response regulator
MKSSAEVLFVGNFALVAWAVERLMEEGAVPLRSRSISDPAQAIVLEQSLAVIAPQTWEEMHNWLPALQTRLRGHPWLMLTHLRIAGLFCSYLEPHVCTVVDTHAAVKTFLAAIQSLAAGEVLFPPAGLLTRFSQGLPSLPGGRQTIPLTPRELQCGCGISLGLYNRQIARVLSISEGTVKKHIEELKHRLGITERGEIGTLFEQAFSSLSPPP